MTCYTLIYASECWICADVAVGLAIILMCNALLYSSACCACAAAPGSRARYVTLRIGTLLCYTQSNVCLVCAAALDGIARYVDLPFAAVCWACAAAPDGSLGALLCYSLQCTVLGRPLPAGSLRGSESLAWHSSAAARAEFMSCCSALLLRSICATDHSFFPHLVS